MDVKLNESIRYYFPKPLNSGKEFVKGQVTFIGETKIVIICEDNSKLTISINNFNRIVSYNNEVITNEKVPDYV
ncbi:MAG: hypothetical protein R6W90_13945 [Ignavibacteriaceae bacterium]